MQKLLTEISDIIFPPSKERLLLRSVTPAILQTLYCPGLFQGVYHLSDYRRPVIRSAVVENKFNHNQQAAQHLGKLLDNWLSKQKDFIIFIPIPLGKKRLRERGHNQVETIINNISLTNYSVSHLLKRKKETAPQSQLDKKDRLKNMNDVFEYTGKVIDSTKIIKYVLIDDVVTTGTTLKAAHDELKQHLPPNVNLICLAIAH